MSARHATPAPTIGDRAGMETPVRELMTAGVVALMEDTSLRQVQRAMHRHRVNAVLIIAADGEPVGWVTSRALLPWLESTDLGLARAGQAIVEPPHAISSSATARDAVAALTESTCSHLLVTRSSDGGIEGVVSALDLVGHLA